jgi:protoporphyrinogen IX oxidase
MLWVKCLHVLGVISWMAGIFYLPRIFVHYAEGRAAGEDVRRLLIMANRLYGFMTILAIVALGAGLWLWIGFGDGGHWLEVKLLFVAALIAYHLGCRLVLGRMRAGLTLPSARALRLLNEAALLIVVPILILAIVKPF